MYNKLPYIFLVLTLLISACTITKKVKSGQSAYELKQYAIAIDFLQKEIKDSNDNQSKAYKSFILGKSYTKLGNHSDALKWYKQAYKLNYGEKALLAYAQCLKSNEEYNLAAQMFEELYQLNGSNRFKREIQVCQTAENWKKTNGQYYKLKSLNSNTEFSEYGPVIFEDKFLVFSSDRFTSIGDEVYAWTGRDFSDLFIMTKSGASVYNFDAQINTKANEGSACFNKDFTEIYFTKCESIVETDDHCRIYFSDRYSGTWSEPRPLFFFDESTNFGQPTLIENDSVIIFAVETDIYNNTHDLFYSVRTIDGWSQPESMPGNINTEGDELFPTNDGDTLYFSSDYHPGMGGLDIFKTYLLADNSWSDPENIQFPLNTGADDFSYIVDRQSSQNDLVSGFLCSNRNGNDDIFSYKQIKKIEVEDDLLAEYDEVIERERELYVALKVVEIIRENNDPNSAILSKEILPDANVKVMSGAVTQTLELDQDGKAIKKLEIGSDYKFKAELIGYLSSSSKLIKTDIDIEEGSIKTINIELELEKISYNQEIILENIYYDFDQWDIRTDAKPVLDSLTNILVDNPLIEIELRSHTDCRGEADYNMNLSQKRAESAVNYIAEKGVKKTRLTARGLGESMLINDCECSDCTEEQHQLNRRTSFVILK